MANKKKRKTINAVGDTIRGVMCGIDAEFHLGHDSYGTKVFPTQAALRKHLGHDPAEHGCGVAQVEVKIVRVLVKQTSRAAKPPR